MGLWQKNIRMYATSAYKSWLINGFSPNKILENRLILYYEGTDLLTLLWRHGKLRKVKKAIKIADKKTTNEHKRNEMRIF